MATEAMQDERLVVDVGGDRQLEVHVYGKREGLPLVFHHGKPGSGLSLSAIDTAIVAQGMRRVGITRPGFGGSARRLGRAVGDVASDVIAVLDHLGAPRCLVAGWSGGGPHALACAALARERVDGVLVIAGSAPYPADGLDWLAGMASDDADDALAAIAGEAALRARLAPRATWYRTATRDAFLELAALRFPPVDVTALSGCADELVASFRDGLRRTVDGWVDDYLALLGPWGFELGDVRVPTALWHGGRDTMAPIAHAEWLAARLPRPTLHLLPQEGHISIGINHIGSMLEQLLTDAY